MNHLDEGTIHAWLDGALGAAQSRDIEAHLAGCSACVEAVAEARGLIAGASRILSALDDVPGNVLPDRATAASPADRAAISLASRRREPRRKWRAAPWVTGIAAVFIGAVVLSTQHRASVIETSAPQAAVSGMERAAEVTSQVERAESAAPSTAVADGAPRARSVPTARRVTPTPAPAPTAGADAAAGSPAQAPPRQFAASAATDAVEKSAAPRTDSARLRVRREDRMDTEALPLGNRTTATADAATIERLVGCYRVELPQGDRIANVATAESAQRGRAAAAAAAPSAAAAPAPATREPAVHFARAMTVIRLDTARAEPGLTVMRVPVDSSVGTWHVLRDSAHVNLGTRGVLMLSAQQKVACP